MNSVTRKSVAVGMLIVVIGMEVFIVQPGFVQGLVEHAGFTDRQAGFIAAAEMFGIALTTVVMALVSGRLIWRRVTLISLIVVIFGNLATACITGFAWFLVLRFLVGAGCGILISIGYAVVGQSAKPDRNFGLLIMCVLIYSALVLFMMPTAYAKAGLTGVLIFFAILAACGLPFIRCLPEQGIAESNIEGETIALSASNQVSALAGVFAFFLGQGVVWAYLFLIGVSNGASEQAVANGLTISQFLGIAGAFTTAMLSLRAGHMLLLILGIIGSVVSLWCLGTLEGALIYGIAVGVFNYMANVITPLLMGIIAKYDGSGKLVVQAVAMQMLGLAIGPALAAAAISPGNYDNIIRLGIGLFSICLIFSMPPLLKRTGTTVNVRA